MRVLHDTLRPYLDRQARRARHLERGHVRLNERRIPSPRPTPEEWIAQDQLRWLIVEALASLRPRQIKVLRLRFGFDGPELTLGEIGRKLRVSSERVRQIESRALLEIRCLTGCTGSRLRGLRSFSPIAASEDHRRERLQLEHEQAELQRRSAVMWEWWQEQRRPKLPQPTASITVSYDVRDGSVSHTVHAEPGVPPTILDRGKLVSPAQWWQSYQRRIARRQWPVKRTGSR